jgi:SP family sugar porter-like MFS transporter
VDRVTGLTHTFPLLEKAIGTGNTFWLYVAICVADFVLVQPILPEIKGKSLGQIERELAG